MTFDDLIGRLARDGYLLTVDEPADKILVAPTAVPIDDTLRHAIREHREALKLLLLVAETFDADLGSVRVEPLRLPEPPPVWPVRPSRRKQEAR